MSTSPRQNTSTTDLPTEPAEIQRDIDRTRAQLADTIDALTDKANVPGRMKEKVGETTEAVKVKTALVGQEIRARTQETMGKLPAPARERLDQLAVAIRQHPLQSTAIALGVGVVVGWISRRR
jgi:ElaB/YqjD/DUF883 family membrane-anchored ribosome-binding protein